MMETTKKRFLFKQKIQTHDIKKKQKTIKKQQKTSKLPQIVTRKQNTTSILQATFLQLPANTARNYRIQYKM